MMGEKVGVLSLCLVFLFFTRVLYKMQWIVNTTANQVATGSFLVLFLWQSCESFVCLSGGNLYYVCDTSLVPA